MTAPLDTSSSASLPQRIRHELHQLVAFQSSDRLWQMPLGAALSTGLPLLVGVSVGRLDFGLTASLGGLVFLYLPETPLHHRMVTLMACAFGLSACFALGLVSHFHPTALIPMLTFIATVVTMVCRYYGVGMPGSLFFIMAAAIGAYSPVDMMRVPLLVGLMTLGTVVAGLIAFFYSLWTLRVRPARPIPPHGPPSFDYVVVDAVFIGGFVGLSLLLASLLSLQKAYWVPVACLAVIQQATLRAVWRRPFYRIIGTGFGLILAWVLLSVSMSPWAVAATMMSLTFLIETLVVRNYTFATVFITPMTLLLAEAASLGRTSPTALIEARLFDTVLGCFVGLLGGVCLHSLACRQAVRGALLRLMPPRLRSAVVPAPDPKAHSEKS